MEREEGGGEGRGGTSGVGGEGEERGERGRDRKAEGTAKFLANWQRRRPRPRVYAQRLCGGLRARPAQAQAQPSEMRESRGGNSPGASGKPCLNLGCGLKEAKEADFGVQRCGSAGGP